MNKMEIRRITNCIHVDIRNLIVSITNCETTENIVLIVKRIQGYLFSLEINESQLVRDYISVVRSLLRQSISVHKSLFVNDIVDTEGLRKATLDYNDKIILFKSEYDFPTLKIQNHPDKNPDVSGVKIFSDRRSNRNKENIDPEDRRSFMSPVASTSNLDGGKLNSSLKNKLVESEKRISQLEVLLQIAEQRAKEAEDRAFRSDQLILNMESELSLQSLLLKILSTDRNYKEVLKQLQLDEKFEKLQSSIKEDRKLLRESRKSKSRSRKSLNGKKPVLSSLASRNGEETDEEKALQQLITHLLM